MPTPSLPVRPLRPAARGARPVLLSLLLACGGDGATPPDDGTGSTASPALAVRGLGEVATRYTSELTVRGTTAYTGGYGRRGATSGNVILVWDVSGSVPALVDSVLVDDAVTVSDVQVSDDGSLLVASTEHGTTGYLLVYGLADPRRPTLLARYSSPNTLPGVHTAEVARVNGTQYAFLSIDPPSRLVVLDLSVPSAPREVFVRFMGNPFLHDVFVRDGLLFTALWHTGLTIWDVGGGGRGGTPALPVELGTVVTRGGSVHNVAWVQLPGGDRRYAWVGEEGPGSIVGARSSGDVHVVDVSDPARPQEVAVYGVPGSGTHNFAVDEARGVLYAAYYDAGVRAIDLRADPAVCTDAQRTPDGRCDLALAGRELAHFAPPDGRPVFVWGVALDGSALYASDMLNGLWKLGTVQR